jgi:hypothetical protein
MRLYDLPADGYVIEDGPVVGMLFQLCIRKM